MKTETRKNAGLSGMLVGLLVLAGVAHAGSRAFAPAGLAGCHSEKNLTPPAWLRSVSSAARLVRAAAAIHRNPGRMIKQICRGLPLI
jgi:hypothetical protein